MFAFLFAAEFFLLIPILALWFIVGLFCLVDDDNPRDGWMTIATLVAVGVGAAVFQPQLVAAWNAGSLLSTLGTIGLYAIGYILVGAAYASIRIIRKAKKQAEQLQLGWGKYSRTVDNRTAPGIISDFMRDQNSRSKYQLMVELTWSDKGNSIELTPKKIKIVGWLSSYAAYWPVYMSVYLVHDIIEWLIDHLYGALVRRIMAQFDGFKSSFNESVVK